MRILVEKFNSFLTLTSLIRPTTLHWIEPKIARVVQDMLPPKYVWTRPGKIRGKAFVEEWLWPLYSGMHTFVEYLEKEKSLNKENAENGPIWRRRRSFFFKTMHLGIITMGESRSFELLPHPQYSPDLAPSDYGLFADLKKFAPEKRIWFKRGGHCRNWKLFLTQRKILLPKKNVF